MFTDFPPWLIWFLIGIVVMLAELVVPGFVIIFFGLGCLGAAVVAGFASNAYSIQLLAFLCVSLLSLATLRKMAMKIFVGRSAASKNDEDANVAVGSRIKIDQDIEPGYESRVRYRGTMWTAISEDRIAAGGEAEVIGVTPTNRSCLKIKNAHRNTE